MNSGSPSHPERQNQTQAVVNSPQSPKLLTQVRNKMRVLHYSIRTESAYVDWIVRFLRFHRTADGSWQHPASLGGPHISEFLTHLAVERHVSASTQNQAFVLSCFLIDRCLNWIRDAWMESVQRDRSECRLFCHTTKFAGFWRRVRLFVPHDFAGGKKYSTPGTKCIPLAGQKAQRRQANPECLRPRLRFWPHYEATRICNHADQFIETRRRVRKLSTFGKGINSLPFRWLKHQFALHVWTCSPEGHQE